MMRSVFVSTALLATAVVVAYAAGSTTSTGWISDSMCGARHMGSGADADCVKKCISNGMKPVFVDPDKQVWAIDNPDAVKAFYGAHVTVTATEDSAHKSMHIATVAEAK